MSKVVDIIRELSAPIMTQNQLELVDVEFVKEGKHWFLRLFVDKAGGVDIEDCALVSEQISDAIDALPTDPIPQAYFLEVSSPGAERPLKNEKDWEQAVGRYIHVSCYQPVDGQKFIEGVLEEVQPDTITLSVKVKTTKKTVTLNRTQIAKARWAIAFN